MSRQPNMVALQESSNRDGDHFLFLNYSPYSFVTLICLVTAIEIHSVAAAVDHPSLSPSLSSLGTVYSLELPTRVSFPHWISLRSLFLLSPVTTFSHVYSRHFRFYRCLTLDLVTDRSFAQPCTTRTSCLLGPTTNTEGHIRTRHITVHLVSRHRNSKPEYNWNFQFPTEF